MKERKLTGEMLPGTFRGRPPAVLAALTQPCATAVGNKLPFLPSATPGVTQVEVLTSSPAARGMPDREKRDKSKLMTSSQMAPQIHEINQQQMMGGL